MVIKSSQYYWSQVYWVAAIGNERDVKSGHTWPSVSYGDYHKKTAPLFQTVEDWWSAHMRTSGAPGSQFLEE